MNIEQYLETHETLIYNNKGVSMLPMLVQDRDLIIVRKKQSGERLRKFDVAIYISPPHQYVLHRIVEVNDTGYVFLGDNCVKKEYGIREKQVIAVLTAFVRNGKKVEVTDLGYRLYSRFWFYIYPLRGIFKKLRLFLKRIKNRISKAKTTV